LESRYNASKIVQGDYMELITKIVQIDGEGYERTSTVLNKTAIGVIEFYDVFFQTCSLQVSSLGNEAVVLFGVDDIGDAMRDPSGKGMENSVAKMILSQKMVKQLLPYLQEFVETGNYIAGMDFQKNETNKEECSCAADVLSQTITERGFGLIKFHDMLPQVCSLQDSSLGTEAAIWFGVHEFSEITKSLSGKKNSAARMHLTLEMVKQLLPYLQKFTGTGRYITDIDSQTKDGLREEEIF